MELSIAAMGAGDVEEVALLERNCFSRPWSLASFEGELSNPLAVYRVARIRGALAGYAGMHHIVDEGAITNIAVAPRYRRQGVGAALLRSLIGYGEEQGLFLMTLEVRAANAAAIALYEKYGFAACGLRKGYYSHPTEDALIMTRLRTREGGDAGCPLE